MIEQNILQWLELGDTIQKIDVYNKKYTLFLFKINYLLSKHMNFSQYFHIVIIILFFGQIWELNLSKTEVEDDAILEIIKYLEKIFLFNKIINNNITFIRLFIIAIVFCLLLALFEIINFTLISFKKNYTFLLYINSILIILMFYYINGPLIQILLNIFLCENGNHIYINAKCSMDNYYFLSSIIICIIFITIIFIRIIIISLYINDMGTLNGSNANSKINCKYTTLISIIKIIYFIMDYLINSKIKYNKIFFIFYQCLFIFINIIISIYVYRTLYYYNQTLNILHHYCWYYSTYFSILILLKNIIKIKNISIFIIFGLILVTIGLYFNDKNIGFKLITELNILQENSLKDIEIYNELLINLSKENNYNIRTLIAGVIKRFEELLSNNLELNENYNKFINDKHLQKKFNSLTELKILSIIGNIYNYNIEKTKDCVDLTLNQCYFLINKCKNPALAIWLCTKIKNCNHIQSYYKYVLMEEIKEYLISKLTKNSNRLSIKHIQISSVILYNQYLDLFKIKIYDATCSQIEYFDILKNNMTNSKTTENFLKIGEDILSLRKDILNLWDKIILLNPFSNESEKDYMIYLDVILQDEVLKRAETKRYNSLKAEKISEKHNKYYSIFNQESNAVLLADGYSYSGKIFYATPNFPSLFMFTGKEIINTSIDDLLPDVIQNFHRYLIEDAIKYSNLIYIFKEQRNVLLKGKNGLIFNINLFVKPVPNLSFGLIYFLHIEKIESQNLIIILDENMHINGFTAMVQIGSNFTINNNYGLSQLINGYHIGLIIPEILLQMYYDIKTNNFSFLKNNLDIKGYLYPIHNFNILNSKIEKILETIKEKRISELSNEHQLDSFEEYDDFIKQLNIQYPKPYSIFFRIVSHTFIKGKYKYYRIYVTNDLLSEFENSISIQSNDNGISEKQNNLKESLLYQSKIKNNNDDSSVYSSSNKPILKNKNQNTQNIIQLKTKLNRQSKILVKKEVEELNKEINNKEINNKENNNKEIYLKEDNLKNKQNLEHINTNINKNKTDFIHPNTESILNQQNIESAEFNKLKNEIINKNDSFYIKLIKILSFIYLILTITLIIYDFYYTKRIVNSIIEFLRENLYFTHTKICTVCIYNAALNLQLVKREIIPQENCPNSNCTLFYSELLKKCYTEVRIQKYDINYYYPVYLKIFFQKINTELYIFNNKYTDHLSLDIDIFLNLMIGHGLKIIANLSNYFDKTPENQFRTIILDVYYKNILSEALEFFYSHYEGFYKEEKESKCDEISYNSPIRIIISLTLFSISSIIIYFLICRKKNMEIYFLDKLINFTSSNFEEYLKNLEELKKKFKDDNNDEEDKNIDEDIGGDDDGKNEKNSKSKEDVNINKNYENNKENTKNKKSKQNKIQQQRLKKKKIMSDYFIKYNLYFGLKLSIVFLLLTSFFVVTLMKAQNMKKGYKQFDSTLEEINEVFFQSFKTFLTFKQQIEIFFRNKDRTELKIPSDSEIFKPKVSNSLMYLIRSSKYSKENLEIIKKLFSSDACEVLTENKTYYNYCENVLSSILTKGLEQAIVQLSLIITSCIDELNSLKNNKNLSDIYNKNSSYSDYEMFVGYYMLESFLKTQTVFQVFRDDEKKSIYKEINLTTSLYIIAYTILILFLIYLIYAYKKIENSFLNFIGILPAKFIADDENFYKSIFKFGQYFY